MANNIPNLQFNQTAPTSPTFGQSSPFGPSMNNLYQPQSIFMQPIGNIYGLSNSSEVGNIPMGSGVSVGLCLAEGTMYLKSMQNNGPVILGYKLSPLETQNTAKSQTPPQDNSIQKIEEILKQYSNKISELEKKIESMQPKSWR